MPELAVRDCAASLRFYVGVLGFTLRYQRSDEGFAYLALGEAELMLDQIGQGRDFATGLAAGPLGRGLNLQIRVSALGQFLAALQSRDILPVVGPEERWYRRGAEEVGQRQLVVADPDGYLLRLQQPIGTRPAR
ncbi:MAG: VOC family protein [Amaricoccus sp.]